MSFSFKPQDTSPLRLTKNLNTSQSKLDTTPQRIAGTTKKQHPYTDVGNYPNQNSQTQSLKNTQKYEIYTESFQRNEIAQLESQVSYLKKELDIQFMKNSKVPQLEQKFEILLLQNQNLQDEVEKLINLNYSLEQELDLAKTQQNIQGRQDLQVENLQIELEEMISRCKDSENRCIDLDRVIQQNQQKFDSLTDEINIKDNELKKLYHVMNESNSDLIELRACLEESHQAHEYDIFRYQKEIDSLKHLVEKRKQIEQELQQQLKDYFNDIIEQQRQEYEEKINLAEQSKEQIEEMIKVNNEELENLREQNISDKDSYQKNEDELRKEIEQLNIQLQNTSSHQVRIQNEYQKLEEEFKQFKNDAQKVQKELSDTQKYNQMFEQKLNETTKQAQDISTELHAKIQYLQGELQSKSFELEEVKSGLLVHDKLQEENQLLKNQVSEQEQGFTAQLQQKDQVILQKQQESNGVQEQLIQQLYEKDHAIQEIQQALLERENEVNEALEQITQERTELEEQADYYKQELDNMRNKYYNAEKEKALAIEDLQFKVSQLELQNREKIKIQEVEIEYQRNEINRFQEQLEKKIQECESIFELKSKIERENRKLMETNEELNRRCSDFNEWKSRQEYALEQQTGQIKDHHQVQVENLNAEIKEQQQKIETKQRENDELVRKVRSLEQALKDSQKKIQVQSKSRQKTEQDESQ